MNALLNWLAAGAALVCLSIPAPGVAAASDGDGMHAKVVGVGPPSGQIGEGSALPSALQQSLVAHLTASGVRVVALSSQDPSALDQEGKAKGCDYVLYTHVERKAASRIGGFLHKMAPLASALPLVAGFGGGGNATGAILAQGAAATSSAMLQQQAAAQLGGAQQSNIHSGDTITLQYRLVAPGGSAALATDTLREKARADGEDVLSPLVAKLAGNVAAVAGGGPGAPAATSPPRADATPGAPTGVPAGMDCDRIAAMPGSTMSAESCKKMLAAQNAYQSAAADPSAARAGDEQMSCAQITAELEKQRYAAPDQAKLGRAQGAGSALQTKLASQQREIAGQAVKDQAALDAAIAADKAVETSSGGTVHSRTAVALQQQQLQANRAAGERMAQERAPQERELTNATADEAGDAGQAVADNPRLARLIQLASAKNCSDQ